MYKLRPGSSLPPREPQFHLSTVGTPNRGLGHLFRNSEHASTAKPEECWSLAASEFALDFS
jgi:hypothetical protein